jgi:hypothetical protein
VNSARGDQTLLAGTTVPGAEHYREIAGVLRQAASSCQFADARKEILHLAAREVSRCPTRAAASETADT